MIHTVGPVWHGGNSGEPELLASCYHNSLKVAEENYIRKIAFPSISTGIYGYPVEKAAKIAVRVMKDYEDAFDEIYMVCFDNKTFEVYSAVIDALQE